MGNIYTATPEQDRSHPASGEATERVAADARAAMDTADEALSKVKEAGAEQLQAVKVKAQEAVEHVGDEARSFAAERKDDAADQLGNVADAIAEVADKLDDRSNPVVAGYARDLAGGLKKASGSVKSHSVDEVVDMVQDFGRQQPLAFLGAAALAGFVASRFVLSSAQRTQSGRSAGTSSPAPAQSSPVMAPSIRERGEF